MNKTTKFKMCNRWLAVIMLLIFISGLQLEVTSGMYQWSVWVHIFLGLVLTILSLYHIFLHYRKKQLVCSFFPQPQYFYPYLMVDIYAYCHQWHSGLFHLGRRLCPLQVGSSSRQARIPDGYHGHYSYITPHKAAKKE